MNKKLSLIALIFLMILSTQFSFGQAPFPEELYEGGKEAFYKAVGKNINYPREARANGQFGTAIVKLYIHPKGKLIKIDLFNPLGFGIEEELARLFKEDVNKWKPDVIKTVTSIIVPITFTLASDYTTKVQGMNQKIPESCIASFVITAYSSGGDSSNFDYDNIYESAKKNAYNNLEKKKLEKALSYFNRLIMMNPFEKEFFKKRIEIENELKISKYRCADVKYLQTIFKEDVSTLSEGCTN